MTELNASDSDGPGGPLAADDWDIRILRRVGRLEDIPLTRNPQEPFRRVGIVDVETTGTDPLHDQVIDIAYVIIDVDARGDIVGIIRRGQGLADPGTPLPEDIVRLTGLTDADLADKVLDLDLLQQALDSVDVLLAHHCRFDSAFISHLLPSTAKAAWACSAKDIDWRAEAGLNGRALGHLLMGVGFFSEAHRAMADVVALIHLLAHRLPDGRTAIGVLLDNAARTSIRVEATGASFSKRHALKARGYQWDVVAKVWWKELSDDQKLEAETLWLGREVMPHGPAPRTSAITWRERHR